MSFVFLKFEVLEVMLAFDSGFLFTWWVAAKTNDYLLKLNIVGLDTDPCNLPKNQWTVDIDMSPGFLTFTGICSVYICVESICPVTQQLVPTSDVLLLCFSLHSKQYCNITRIASMTLKCVLANSLVQEFRDDFTHRLSNGFMNSWCSLIQGWMRVVFRS